MGKIDFSTSIVNKGIKQVPSILRKTFNAINTLVLITTMALSVGCSNHSTPPQPPGKTTQSGQITDVYTKGAVPGALVSCSESSSTTDASGNYSIQYTEGTIPVITVAQGSFITRTTFTKFGPNYSLINNSADINFFNQICRPTLRWSEGTLPSVYITTDYGPPAYFKTLIEDIVDNDIPKLTAGKLTGLSISYGLKANAPTKDVIIYDYDSTLSSCVTDMKCNSDSSISWSYVGLGAKTATGIQDIPRAVAIHETGHAIGMTGHASTRNSIMFDSPGTTYTPEHPAQMDIDNGTLLYNRPPNNTAPDNDPTPPGASTSVANYQTFENAVDNQGSIMSFDPTGTSTMMKPREWFEYENRMQTNQRELKAYEHGREKHAPDGAARKK